MNELESIPAQHKAQHAYPLPSWVSSLRPGQIDAIDHAVTCFRNGYRTVLLDAPTGFGKTLTAEMIRRELNIRALYVCTSKPLQSQFKHDFPYAALLKGRSNYPTLNFPDDFEDPHYPITAADCDKDETHCTFCDPVWNCPYEIDKHTALREDLSCLNTAYLLTETNFIGKFSNAFPLIIIDEADKLEDELLRHIEVTVSKRLINQLKLGYPSRKTKEEAWVEWAEQTHPLIRVAATRIQARTPKAIKQRAQLVSLAKKLEKVAEEMVAGGWVYEETYNGGVNFKPIRVTNWAYDNLWKHAPRFLLMSGTLIPPEIIQSLDPLTPHSSYEAVSSFPTSNRPIRICPVTPMSRLKNDASGKQLAWGKMAMAIGRIMNLHPNERILVHTVTYSLANFLYDALDKSRLILYTQAAQREGALRRFNNLPNGVLLACSLDRGIDLPDDMCRVVCVCKIPHGDLGDKQIQARLYEPGVAGAGQTWYAVKTIRTLIQMLGRAVRHEGDQAVHYILDDDIYKLSREWGHLIPKWVKDAFVWGGPWKKVITQGLT